MYTQDKPNNKRTSTCNGIILLFAWPVVWYPEKRSKDFSKKKKYSRILTDDKNVDRTFSRNTKMSTGHLVENQNIDRNNIEGSKI